ncbi:Tctex-1 [Trinorchestia longiramus]|nr:Tctex-1 [Trinorchestia longiramus]
MLRRPEPENAFHTSNSTCGAGRRELKPSKRDDSVPKGTTAFKEGRQPPKRDDSLPRGTTASQEGRQPPKRDDSLPRGTTAYQEGRHSTTSTCYAPRGTLASVQGSDAPWVVHFDERDDRNCYKMTAADTTQNFQIRPPAKEKLRASMVKEVIHTVLVDQLSQYRYDGETADETVNTLAETIRTKLSDELSVERYKLVVHVVLGEQRGGGVKVGARCLWDTDSDTTVYDNFLSSFHLDRKLSSVQPPYSAPTSIEVVS